MIKRAYDTFHKIDGSPLLMPDIDVEITFEDIEASDGGFDQSFYYHRIVIRYSRRSWKFKYAALTKEEFVYLKSLVSGKETFKFQSLNENDETEEVLAYAKPLTVTYQSKRSGLFKNFNLEIIEC